MEGENLSEISMKIFLQCFLYGQLLIIRHLILLAKRRGGFGR